MKRINHLYKNTYKIENIISAYNEVCRNTKNKRKIANYKQYKCIYISRIYNDLKNRTYEVGPSSVFKIYEPKERRIVSQSIHDKIINHLVSREILYPALLPCLIPENVASIKHKGTKEGLRLAHLYHSRCKSKYGTYYILKCDISKFFASIDQSILKKKVSRKIKDPDALNIIYKIIDSEEQGLGIGNMTSQVLAVFYLNDLDHFIKENLKIKYYVRYQDDFLLFHQSKDYLKQCYQKIVKFLKKENLTLNNKSRLYKNTNNFIFLGRNSKGNYTKYRNVKRKLRYKRYLYETNKISFHNYLSSYMAYKNSRKKIDF